MSLLPQPSSFLQLSVLHSKHYVVMRSLLTWHCQTKLQKHPRLPAVKLHTCMNLQSRLVDQNDILLNVKLNSSPPPTIDTSRRLTSQRFSVIPSLHVHDIKLLGNTTAKDPPSPELEAPTHESITTVILCRSVAHNQSDIDLWPSRSAPQSLT